jgi:hypothetical protein
VGVTPRSKRPFVTTGSQAAARGDANPLKVTLTVIICGPDNQQHWLHLFICPWGGVLKSAYVHGIRRLRDLNRGQIVRFAGSGAAVVEAVWMDGEQYFGRFQFHDGLSVVLTEAEEAMIGTLTRL